MLLPEKRRRACDEVLRQTGFQQNGHLTLLHLLFRPDKAILAGSQAALPNTHYLHSHGTMTTQTLYP